MNPIDPKVRFVRIPIPLRRESKKFKPFLLKDLISIHKRSINREKRKLGITDYGLLWIQFFRGILFAIIIDRLIFH